MNTLLWAFIGVLAAALVLQGVWMRASYRRKVAAVHSKQMRIEEAANGRLEQTKRQVAKLQNDLAAARLQLKNQTRMQPATTVPAAAAAGAATSPNREALERELAERDEAHAKQPPGDGFADTQPAVSTQFGSLLLQ